MTKLAPPLAIGLIVAIAVLMQMVAGFIMDGVLTAGVGLAAYGLGLLAGVSRAT